MNVFFFTRWYPDKYDPSYGLFIQRHAEAVSKFCNISILYIRSDENLSKPYEIEYFQSNNIHVVRLYYKKYSFLRFINLILYFYYFKKGYQYIKKTSGKPDIIHVNILTRAGIPAYFLKKFYNIPYIITEHWSRYQEITNNYKGTLRKIITRIIVENASAVTTVTANLKQAMLQHKLFNKNYIIIPNVVDTDIFTPDSNKHTHNKVIITHISSFEDKSKNVTGILRVIKALSKKKTDFEFILVGDLNDHDKIIKYAEELELKDKLVFFEGLLDTKQLVQVLQKTDFLLMFSNYENFPVVINESLSCGIPIISTDVGGISEYIDNNLGILVKAGQEEDLLIAIIKMMDNYRKYDKNYLRSYAIENFGMNNIGKKFLKIYKDCLGIKE